VYKEGSCCAVREGDGGQISGIIDEHAALPPASPPAACLPACYRHPQFPTGPPSLDESHPLIIHFILSSMYFINSSFHVFRLLVMEFSPPSVVTLHPSLASLLLLSGFFFCPFSLTNSFFLFFHR
jgi:hypothetical protein